MPINDDVDRGRFDRKRERAQRRSKQLPTEDELPLPPPTEPIHADEKHPRRNEPCPCGSGKKYKKCCGVGR